MRSAIANSGARLPAARAHHQPLAGRPAEARVRVRPGHRPRRASPRTASWRANPSIACVHLGELGLDGRLRPIRGMLPVGARRRAGRVRHRHGARGQRRRGVARARNPGRRRRLAARGGDLARRRRSSRSRSSRSCRSPPPNRPTMRATSPTSSATRRRRGAAGRRGRRAPPVPARAARRRQDDARLTPARHPARPRRRGGPRGQLDPVARRNARSAPSLATRPPLEAPAPHGDAPRAIVGGGSRIIRPGAAARAAHGVLFLDEAPEFAPAVLDALRQPLESGVITHPPGQRRPRRFPARFQLVLAANPCPCGNYGVRGRGVHLPAVRPPPLPRSPLAARCSTGSTSSCGVPRITTAQLAHARRRSRRPTARARGRGSRRRELSPRSACAERPGGSNAEVPGSLAARRPGPRIRIAPRCSTERSSAAASRCAATTACSDSRGRSPTSTVWPAPASSRSAVRFCSGRRRHDVSRHRGGRRRPAGARDHERRARSCRARRAVRARRLDGHRRAG